MNHAHAVLTAEERAIVAEEEILLERARSTISRHVEKAARAPRGGDLRSIDALRALREEATRASEDDLPPLLLELSVRQRNVGAAFGETLPHAQLEQERR